MPSEHRFSLAPWKPVALDDLVRLGRDQDGGYVLPRRCVEATSVLIGFGIFDDWSFEEAFAVANPRAGIVGVDGTVSYREFRNRAGEAKMRALIALARFRVAQASAQAGKARHWMSRARDLGTFFDVHRRRLHSKHISDVESQWETTWQTLTESEDLIRSSTDPTSIFVKMDIEGSEYRVLDDILTNHRRINGLVVEFHDVDIHWGRFAELMDRASEHFAVAHIHGNNYHALARGTTTPRALEISFVNRQLVSSPAVATTDCHPIAGLDRPCDPTRPDYVIQF